MTSHGRDFTRAWSGDQQRPGPSHRGLWWRFHRVQCSGLQDRWGWETMRMRGPGVLPLKGSFVTLILKSVILNYIIIYIYILSLSLSPSLYAMFNHMSSRSWTGLWAGLRRKLSNDQRDQFIEDYFSVNGLGCLVCKNGELDAGGQCSHFQNAKWTAASTCLATK